MSILYTVMYQRDSLANRLGLIKPENMVIMASHSGLLELVRLKEFVAGTLETDYVGKLLDMPIYVVTRLQEGVKVVMG